MSDFEKLINANDLIEWIMETYPDWCVGDVRSIVDHVEDMPSAEPETCAYWDRESNLCALHRPSAEPDPSDAARAIATIIENEKDMRVIAQPIRKGKWIEEKEDWRNQIMWVSCSECGFASGTSYNFCPNCGASMSEGEEDEP